MSDSGIQLFMVVLLSISISAYIITGRIRLYMAPEKWREVERGNDPGRYWAFICALSVVLVGILIDLLV